MRDLEFELNMDLVRQRGLTEKEVLHLYDLHEVREELFERFEATADREELRELVNKLETLEFEMQVAWRFPVDRNFHTWWYRAPKCQCPQMDNIDAFGSERIINKQCPLHGD
jgi:hypothetical protein